MLFVLGGFGRAVGRPDSAFMAKSFVAQGISVAIVEYTLAPIATLDQIVGQIRRALDFLLNDHSDLGYSPQKVFIGGSSAGAHLAAMTLASDLDFQPRNAIKGALLASGLYDLTPLEFCKPNLWLKLDSDAAQRNSPILLPSPTETPFVIFWGETETAEFKRQSTDYVNKISVSGCKVTAFEVSNRNHFNVITTLADPTSQAYRVALDMIETKA